MLLLLPVAYLLSAGRWWALAIPLVTAWPLVDITPPIVYPIVFWVTLVARRSSAGARPTPAVRAVTTRVDRALVLGLGVVARVGGPVLAVEPLLRCQSRRLLLAGRRVPARPDVAGVPARRRRVQRRHRRRRPLLRARSRRSRRSCSCPSWPSSGPWSPTRSSPGSTPSWPPAASGCAGGCSGGSASQRLIDRLWLVVLFGFSTQILWVTTRGGVWHTGHLVATILTLACLIELYGSRRRVAHRAAGGRRVHDPGAAGLRHPGLCPAARAARHPRAAASCWTTSRGTVRALPWRTGRCYGLGVLPALIALLRLQPGPLRDAARVRLCPGDPARLAGGAARAGPVLDRPHPDEPGLLPGPPAVAIDESPFFKPDGLGMSVLLTSPGLLLAFRADWRRRDVQLLWLTAFLVLVPTLLYYGGGWLQYGYRYFLDSVPFVHGPVRAGRRPPRRRRPGLAGRSSCSGRSSWPSASTGPTTCDPCSGCDRSGSD